MKHIVQQRLFYRPQRTPSEVLLDGKRICFALEDELREQPGVPVAQWKIAKVTAIPAGDFALQLVDSPKHGKETMRLVGVPGFEFIDIHGGNNEGDTEGCIITGTELDREGKIPGGKSKPALTALRAILVPWLKVGEEVVWSVRNPAHWAGPPQPDPLNLLEPLKSQLAPSKPEPQLPPPADDHA